MISIQGASLVNQSGPHLAPSCGPVVCQTRVQSGEPKGPDPDQAFHCAVHAAVGLWTPGQTQSPQPRSRGCFRGEVTCGWV